MFTLWLLHNSLPTLAPEASLWHAVGSQPGIVSARLDCDPGGRELSPDPIREGARSSEAAAGGGEREGRGAPAGLQPPPPLPSERRTAHSEPLSTRGTGRQNGGHVELLRLVSR